MKNSRCLTFFLALCMALSLVCPVFAVEAPGDYDAGGTRCPAPEVSARCVLLADLDTDQVYYAKQANKGVPPASLTKVLTVLLALEAAERGEVSLSDVVTAQDDCRYNFIPDASTADIAPGERMTLENLLYCAMLPSANEATNIIARYVAGSISKFVDRMNARAKELGCTSSHFMNTNGLPADGHYTTAADLWRITRQALKNPTFAKICNTPSRTVPGTNMHAARTLQNTNGLINPDSTTYPGYLYAPAAGVKTGYTGTAGYCLISTAEKFGLRLLCVVLGSSRGEKSDGSTLHRSFTDTIALYEWLFGHFSVQTVLRRDETVSAGGKALHPVRNFTAVLPNGTDPAELERSVREYFTPAKDGSLGEVTLKHGSRTLGTVPLAERAETPAPAADNPFEDVKTGSYCHAPVLWAVQHEPQITNGISDELFAPGWACTRAQAVTFLWRAAGCPEPKSQTCPFGDVKPGSFYEQAVLWAVERGVTSGTSETAFSPEHPCTRAQIVTFLWRLAGEPAAGGNLPFRDIAHGQYYTGAVLWAAAQGVTGGTEPGVFAPENPCTRGQIVTFLYRAAA